MCLDLSPIWGELAAIFGTYLIVYTWIIVKIYKRKSITICIRKSVTTELVYSRIITTIDEKEHNLIKGD